jgi:DNA-directed RNA polymerase subunit RPC12/RpoP
MSIDRLHPMWQYFIYREINKEKRYSCEDCWMTFTKPEIIDGKPACPYCHSTHIKEML